MLDGTGFEAHHVSRYFVRRRANNGKTRHDTTCRRFPKAGVLCDCRSHLILSIAPDVPHFRAALDDESVAQSDQDAHRVARAVADDGRGSAQLLSHRPRGSR